MAFVAEKKLKMVEKEVKFDPMSKFLATHWAQMYSFLKE